MYGNCINVYLKWNLRRSFVEIYCLSGEEGLKTWWCTKPREGKRKSLFLERLWIEIHIFTRRCLEREIKKIDEVKNRHSGKEAWDLKIYVGKYFTKVWYLQKKNVGGDLERVRMPSPWQQRPSPWQRMRWVAFFDSMENNHKPDEGLRYRVNDITTQIHCSFVPGSS